jgi:hypothetical protein
MCLMMRGFFTIRRARCPVMMQGCALPPADRRRGQAAKQEKRDPLFHSSSPLLQPSEISALHHGVARSGLWAAGLGDARSLPERGCRASLSSCHAGDSSRSR